MAFGWNSLELSPPPNRSILTENKDITELKRVCTNFKNILDNQKNLHVEAALLSRIIYRFKTKLRRDKGLQTMEKVNRCLLHYLKLNLASIYSNFTSCIRASVDGYKTNEIYAPTKQMLEYLLMRTQGFAKLMGRVVQVSEMAGKYLMDRINIGHSWNLALVSISIVARIWSLSKYLVLAACEHYNKLLPFLKVLSYTGIPWFSEDINFPGDLKDWLNLEWLSKSSDDTGNLFRSKKQELSESKTMLNKVFARVSGINSEEKTANDQRPEVFFCKGEAPTTDLGERVSRTSIQKSTVCNGIQPLNEDKSKKKKLCKEENIFKSVKSVKDLTNFVRNEERLRVSQREAAVTKHLDNFQFHMFKKRVLRVVSKLNKIDSKENESHFDVVFKKSIKVLKLYVPF
ncbi:hypothetical protein J437_LFUL006193 [Ladona fulva]|uniref:Nucleolus and neural progenitor protein-like N-terminal domain-containing protein n=1 Tax=Ladona fulva TaxID=123851 RepID=A0A8K0NZU2_LADFU|nr:hypothetical protein J437_LFUL006193 [Ladona fulva]